MHAIMSLYRSVHNKPVHLHWRCNSSLPADCVRIFTDTACDAVQSILPGEAVLLNSLRRLLTFVPQTNDLLTSWARTTADSPGRERMPTPNQSPSKSDSNYPSC